MKKSTSRYKTSNATTAEEAKARENAFKGLNDPILKGVNGEMPFAIVYGVTDSKGRKKLFKYCPIFYSSYSFENYLIKHKQPVLAVYDRNHTLN